MKKENDVKTKATMIEIPFELLLALLLGNIEIEMKSISLNEYLEKEKVN